MTRTWSSSRSQRRVSSTAGETHADSLVGWTEGLEAVQTATSGPPCQLYVPCNAPPLHGRHLVPLRGLAFYPCSQLTGTFGYQLVLTHVNGHLTDITTVLCVRISKLTHPTVSRRRRLHCTSCYICIRRLDRQVSTCRGMS
jgi:hypothetical protein